MSDLNLMTASSSSLAVALLNERFAGDAAATTEFLQQTLANIPSDTRSLIKSDKKDIVHLAAPNLGDSLLRSSDNPNSNSTDSSSSSTVVVTCVQPRGKMEWSIHQRGLQWTDKKGDSLVLPAGTMIRGPAARLSVSPQPVVVEHVLCFPKPEDCRAKKKKIGYMVLLVLSTKKDDGAAACNKAAGAMGVATYKGKEIPQICFQLPEEPPKLLGDEGVDAKDMINDNDSDNDDDNDDTRVDCVSLWLNVLTKALNFDPASVTRVDARPDSNKAAAFVSYTDHDSSSTLSGLPFVPCYYGVKDGSLFPLESGLLFYKPSLFVPRQTLHALECAGSNRYTTLSVTLDDTTTTTEEDDDDDSDGAVPSSGTTLEFTNIHKAEQDGLQRYIHGTLIPAMQRDANDSGGGSDASHNGDEVSNHQYSEENSPPTNNNNPRKRKASAQAEILNRKMQHRNGGNESDKDGDGSEDDDEDFAAGDDDDEDRDEDDDDDEEDGGESSDEEEEASAADDATESEDEDYE